MRKGMSLVELLILMAILSFVSFALAGLFVTLSSDIPRSCRVTQTNTTLLAMLKQMHKDIDSAEALLESFAEHIASDKLLLIKLADGVICYQLRDGEVLRCKLTKPVEDSSEDTTVWSVPHAKIEWQVWRENNKGYAVEVKTCIEHKVRGHWERKMANSHLYFVGAFGKAVD